VVLFLQAGNAFSWFAEKSTVELSLPNDDRVQVFGPGHRYYDYLVQYAKGRRALRDRRCWRRRDRVDGFRDQDSRLDESDQEWTWLHFRDPDGNLYALASRRSATG
jgi:hypothetical protein